MVLVKTRENVMPTERKLIVVFVVLFIAAAMQAQRGAGRGTGGSGQGQMSRQQQGTQQQGSNQEPSMRSQQQMRVQSQATDRQRTAMRQMVTATKQLRTELREMTHLKSGQQVGADQAKLWRERIQTQLEALQQQQQLLLTSLTEDQQSWVEDDIQQLTQSTSGLVDKLEMLDVALAEEELDEQAIKDAAKKADDQTKKVASEEKQILDELVFRLSWKWRERSSVKIAERTYEERA
jgi:hypothetical protein